MREQLQRVSQSHLKIIGINGIRCSIGFGGTDLSEAKHRGVLSIVQKDPSRSDGHVKGVFVGRWGASTPGMSS